MEKSIVPVPTGFSDEAGSRFRLVHIPNLANAMSDYERKQIRLMFIRFEHRNLKKDARGDVYPYFWTLMQTYTARHGFEQEVCFKEDWWVGFKDSILDNKRDYYLLFNPENEVLTVVKLEKEAEDQFLLAVDSFKYGEETVLRPREFELNRDDVMALYSQGMFREMLDDLMEVVRV